MKPLTLEALDEIVSEIKSLIRDAPIAMQPTMLLIQPALQKQAMRILYWKPHLRKLKGMRGRKKAIYWRYW